MQTDHHIVSADAREMTDLEADCVDLIVTSPPYPIISMWDAFFCSDDSLIEKALNDGDGALGFERMHRCLDDVWQECYRVLKPGGLMCVNIGDAVRTIGGEFQLFPNHVRITTKLLSLGLFQLPSIIWRKPTNAPNKFMGSGMLPPGAYVTLEHEYVLIFRKGGKREFPDHSKKQSRRMSAYFWEERNAWFSDVWFDLRGITQKIEKADSRERSAAFPFELPFRLINMFSLRGDLVLDPFLGTGTTMHAAMCAARNSVGYEIDTALFPVILANASNIVTLSKVMVEKRILAHLEFVEQREKIKGIRHRHRIYGFPVVTRQEEDLYFDTIAAIQFLSHSHLRVMHEPWQASRPEDANGSRQWPLPAMKAKGRQLKLF